MDELHQADRGDSGHDIGVQREREAGIVIAGTEDLLAAAVTSMHGLVRDHASAQGFLDTYLRVRTFREEHEGAFPPGIYPPEQAAIQAVDDLRAARTQNVMASPELNAACGGDRRAADSSAYVSGTPVAVVSAVLERLTPHPQG